MIREFKFFRGYELNPFDVVWNNINRINDINRLTVTPGYGTITIPNYYPNHFIGDYPLTGTGTITTTPNYLGTGYVTIPRISSGTVTTTTGFSLTTSNTNGTTTYTTAGMGGAFTTTGTISTNTFYNSNIK
jgi:hypothetical protein